MPLAMLRIRACVGFNLSKSIQFSLHALIKCLHMINHSFIRDFKEATFFLELILLKTSATVD